MAGYSRHTPYVNLGRWSLTITGPGFSATSTGWSWHVAVERARRCHAAGFRVRLFRYSPA